MQLHQELERQNQRGREDAAEDMRLVGNRCMQQFIGPEQERLGQVNREIAAQRAWEQTHSRLQVRLYDIIGDDVADLERTRTQVQLDLLAANRVAIDECGVFFIGAAGLARVPAGRRER